MTGRRGPLQLTADQVVAVRKALGETQAEFSDRFYRSRYSILRWEQDGVKFKYKSLRYQIWFFAVGEAIQQAAMSTKGTEHEQIESLRALRVFPTQ